MKDIFDSREKDWRNKQVIYQIFVDRFHKGQNTKPMSLYPPSCRLKDWDELPKHDDSLTTLGCMRHELDFWGGDLAGVIQKFEYIKNLGINTIYFNPIFESITNHKYDTVDYHKIDPQFGDQKTFEKLVDLAHSQNIRVIIDGVFNHISIKSKWFLDAQKNTHSPYREFFDFSAAYPNGYAAWENVKNLAELQMCRPAVQKEMIFGKNSVIKKYLKIVDGIRLDVANCLSPLVLKQITDIAHKENPKSIIIGETWNYPDGWLDTMDGIMNFYMRQSIFNVVKQEIAPRKFNIIIEKMIIDSGIEGILKSWNILSNHDLPRLTYILPTQEERALSIFLQYTLPGSPVLYYGEELAMLGGNDPECRAPMRWDQSQDYEKSDFVKMIAIRNNNRALQIGDFVPILSKNFIAFARKTNKIKDYCLMLANPSDNDITETIALTEYKLMDGYQLKDIFSSYCVKIHAGVIQVTLRKKEKIILQPIIPQNRAYNPYKYIDQEINPL